MIKVLICDDHKIVIEGIELILSQDENIKLVDIALSGKEVLEKLKVVDIDIILLDINLPDINGIEICKLISRTAPTVKVIALTMSKDLSLIKLMLNNGAKGYVLKNASKSELLEAIRTVVKGETFLDKEVNNLVINDISNNKNRITKKSVFPSLSRREKEIMTLIMNELTNQEIAEKLFISLGTVETHRRNILSKLGARNTAGLVRIVIEYSLLNN